MIFIYLFILARLTKIGKDENNVKELKLKLLLISKLFLEPNEGIKIEMN